MQSSVFFLCDNIIDDCPVDLLLLYVSIFIMKILLPAAQMNKDYVFVQHSILQQCVLYVSV